MLLALSGKQETLQLMKQDNHSFAFIQSHVVVDSLFVLIIANNGAKIICAYAINITTVWKVAIAKSSCKQNHFSKQFEISNWFEFTSGLM